jgi:hypothetical protein
MLFMNISTWEPAQRDEATNRLVEKGTMFPENVKVLGQWTDLSGGRSFLLFETDDPKSILAATRAWSDLLKSEMVPVMAVDEILQLIQG